jgi:hypothetical protein
MAKFGDPNVNREYKDGVFRMLFNEQEAAAELYSAFTGEACPAQGIKIETMRDGLFRNFANDVAIRANDRVVVFVEHQSTINPNMPLRMAIYFGRIYESFLQARAIYGSQIRKIPTPEFIVLYNGEREVGEKLEYRLSDAFLAPPRFGCLELVAQVYDINYGHSSQLLQRSRLLSDYSRFIDVCRRRNEKLRDWRRAVEEAVRFCASNGILADFLKKHGSEVINLLTAEFTREDEVKLAREDGMEAGRMETAKRLFALGLEPEVIRKATALSQEAIVKLQRESHRAI